MEFLSYLFFFVIGFYTAVLLISRQLKNAIHRIAKENNIDLEEKPKVVKVPVMKTEPIMDGILLYDTKNNFMCQGKSLEELAENLLKYKNIKLAMIVHDNDKFLVVEGKVEKAQ